MMRVKYCDNFNSILLVIFLFIYIYIKIPSLDLIVLLLFGAMPNIFSGFLDILELKYEQDRNKILIKRQR